MIILNVFDPKDYEIYVYGTKWEHKNVPCYTLATWANRADADWVFNLAFFDFRSAYNDSHNIGGRTLQKVYNPSIGDIGCEDAVSRTELITIQGSQFRGWNTAVKDGVVQNISTSGKRARNMNGITTDGRYIHVTSDRQTEWYVANWTNNQIKKKYNTTIKYLFIEDSGGSTQEYSAISKLGYYPEGQRAVPNVICINRKNPYTFNRVLSLGKRGEDVKILQQALGGIEVDGSFGFGTLSRLKQAQRQLGLQADGYAGPLTVTAMGFKHSY